MKRAHAKTFTSAVVTVVGSWLASGRALAQDVPEPPVAPEAMAEGASAGLVAVLAVGGLLVIMGVAVKLIDLRTRRESENAQLQALISDALLRERSLTRVPLTPTVRVPMWSGSPATIDVKGQVPTGDLKDTILRIVREEATRIRPDVEIEDHVSVDPTMVRAA